MKYDNKFFKFSSVSEFWRYCENITPDAAWGAVPSSETDNDDNKDTASWEEAQKKILSGCPEIVAALKVESAKIAQARGTAARRFSTGVCGFAPVVPLFLQGVPENMITTRSAANRKKVINVFYNAGFPCSISTEDITKTGAYMIQAIKDLESAGYRVNLDCGTVTEYNDAATAVFKRAHKFGGTRLIALSVRVKNSAEYFNLSRLSYCLASSSFLRRHSFRVRETLPYYIPAYGWTCTNTDKIKTVIPSYDIIISGYNYYDKPAELLAEVAKQVKKIK